MGMDVLRNNIETWLPLILGSTVLSTLVTTAINQFSTSYRDRRKERKELIAKASVSVLKRVELCYRIRRRSADGSEDKDIKNMIHAVQEENSYYENLLLIESRWFGLRYSAYLSAIKVLTGNKMQKAWDKDGDPKAVMEEELKLDHKKIEKFSRQFAKDSGRFFNPLMRAWMRVHDHIRKPRKYDIEKSS